MPIESQNHLDQRFFFFFLDLNVIFSDHHYLFKRVKTTLKAVVMVEKKNLSQRKLFT